MDQIFYDAQRQGRISFYMTAAGEEAIHIGCGAALDNADMVFAQYREAGVLMWRGFTLQQFADQCFSNVGDPAKGRQMPIHYGSKELNYQTISSPLSTQIPQATGAAYSYKLDMLNGGPERIAGCFFGDGAASEGDFHAALNFAATLDTPILFMCRNNGFAISTPVKDQYRGDGIASRGVGYGMATIRVDGNDLLAVLDVTKKARKYAIENSAPVLIEYMTYRQGHHSTSDDSTRYRSIDEIKGWKENDDPLTRMRNYMVKKGWWNDEMEQSTRDTERMNVLTALEKAETKPYPSLDTLFYDVYKERSPSLVEQEEDMLEHARKYPDKYPIN
jgi:2-oxoisovalerate dehydrogenase E1 component alpha subunit